MEPPPVCVLMLVTWIDRLLEVVGICPRWGNEGAYLNASSWTGFTFMGLPGRNQSEMGKPLIRQIA